MFMLNLRLGIRFAPYERSRKFNHILKIDIYIHETDTPYANLAKTTISYFTQ